MEQIKKTIDFLFTYKFILLLLTLIAQIFIPVYFANSIIYSVLSYVFITITLVVSILIFKNIRMHKLYIVFVVLVLLIILLNWVDYFGNVGAIVRIPRLLFVGGMYVTVFVNIFKEFGNRKEVDIDFIFGAISAYLLLGLISSFSSVIIEFYFPGSFSFAVSPIDFQDHIYFNFVTLTTLGYGDISPITPQGQMHAVAVALVGQLYLTITIALIVGRYLSNVRNSKKQ